MTSTASCTPETIREISMMFADEVDELHLLHLLDRLALADRQTAQKPGPGRCPQHREHRPALPKRFVHAVLWGDKHASASDFTRTNDCAYKGPARDLVQHVQEGILATSLLHVVCVECYNPSPFSAAAGGRPLPTPWLEQFRPDSVACLHIGPGGPRARPSVSSFSVPRLRDERPEHERLNPAAPLLGTRNRAGPPTRDRNTRRARSKPQQSPRRGLRSGTRRIPTKTRRPKQRSRPDLRCRRRSDYRRRDEIVQPPKRRRNKMWLSARASMTLRHALDTKWR